MTAAAKELARCTLDLVGVQEVRWNKGPTVGTGDYNLFHGKGNENHESGTGFCFQYRIVSAVKRAEFVSYWMTYIVLKRRWCSIIVLNVRAPSEEKNYDSKCSFL